MTPPQTAPETVIVVGAGIAGVSTAYELALRGVKVTLIDQRGGAGEGTSYANGGQLSACEVAPWAGPEIPWLVLKWLGRDDAPFRLRPKMDPEQWLWLMRFLMRCRTSARRERIGPNLELALLTRARLEAYKEEFAQAGARFDYERKEKGILRIFRDAHELGEAEREAAPLARMGVGQERLTPAECIALEPALAPAMQRGDIAGGLYAASDGSGDAHLYSLALAEGAKRRGAAFLANADVRRLVTDGARIRGVETSEGLMEADAVVLAAGAGSQALLRPLGLRSYIYPVKGYSVTLPAPEGNAPEVSITDEARKIVVSHLGGRLRAAGQAEVGGYDLTLEQGRAKSVMDSLESLFPQTGSSRGAAEYWCGLRPMTPDGSPVLGAVPRFCNLFMNSGHGTLGWTLGAGSAAVVADLICGGALQLDLGPFYISRF